MRWSWILGGPRSNDRCPHGNWGQRGDTEGATVGMAAETGAAGLRVQNAEGRRPAPEAGRGRDRCKTSRSLREPGQLPAVPDLCSQL